MVNVYRLKEDVGGCSQTHSIEAVPLDLRASGRLNARYA